MNNLDAVHRLLTEYYRTFSTLNVQNIAPFFHQPCLFVSPQGVMAAPTHVEVSEVFRVIAEAFRAKEYSRSDLIVKDSKLLSASAALVTGIAVRYKTDGNELERVDVTYLLHNSNNEWKIAVIVIHDPQID